MQKLHHAIIGLVFTLPGLTGIVFAGELRFAAENIDVTLYPPDTVEVTGEYFFTSSDGLACKQRVIYPFPADTAAEVPCSVTVRKGDPPQNVSFNLIDDGISFGVEVPEEDTVAMTVTYRQCFRNKTGRYILSTTTFWGRPLSDSRYSLRVPVNTTLKYLSYECDTVYVKGTNRIYSFFKTRFLPERDLVFIW